MPDLQSAENAITEVKFIDTPRFAIALSAASIAISILLTVLGVRMKHLSILIAIAWMVMIPAVWIWCRSIKGRSFRMAVFLGTVALSGCAFWFLNRLTTPIEAKPVSIIWSDPAPLKAGSRLTALQLNARAMSEGKEVPGEYLYEPASGSTIAAGGQTLKVTFTPKDTSTYQPKEETTVIEGLPGPSPAPTVVLREMSRKRTADPSFIGMSSITRNRSDNSDVWLASGSKFGVNLAYEMKGEADAVDWNGASKVYFLSNSSEESLHKEWIDFIGGYSNLPEAHKLTFQSGQKEFTSAISGRALDEDDVDKVLHGQIHILLLWIVRYRDEAGSHHIYGCLLMQQPRSTDPAELPIWQNCDPWNWKHQ